MAGQRTKEQQHDEMRRKRRRKRIIQAYIARTVFALSIFFLVFLVFMLSRVIGRWAAEKTSKDMNVMDDRKAEHVPDEVVFAEPEKKKVANPPEIMIEYLTFNDYSRVGHWLPEVNNIFVHYTANPGTSAAQNRSYFENLKDTHETSASAHFIIGTEGEIIQCIPLSEVAYAVAGRNFDSVSIECCYNEENGKFTDATYQSLVHLAAWLISKYNLNVEDILRHYDANGKNCPKYFVENEFAWVRFQRDVVDYIEENAELISIS